MTDLPGPPHVETHLDAPPGSPELEVNVFSDGDTALIQMPAYIAQALAHALDEYNEARVHHYGRVVDRGWAEMAELIREKVGTDPL